MSRRIEVELTSARGDGSWTWRAAGAREPRGVLDGSILPASAKAGDVLRVEADFDLDGVTVTGLAPVVEKHRNEAQRIEIIGKPQRDDELITSTLVPKGKGDRDRPGRGPRRDRDDRPPRGDRDDRGPRRDGDRRPRSDGDRPDGAPRGDRRPPRPPRVEEPARPKPKRLRPKRVHRSALLDELPVEHRPIAEQVMQGDVPAVRQAIDKENEARAERGEPPIAGTEIIAIAEKLRPRVRTAEWHDRADAAMADIDELDLRDLRSVVVAADSAARDEETRALAAQLREALARRVEEEQAAWVAELTEALDSGRVVRALRLSSRPPKAGALLRPELSARLAEAASASLTDVVAPDRWAVLLDAIAHSPVRLTVKPQSLPEKPGDELLTTVKKLSSRIPEIAGLFGVEVSEAPKARGPRRPPRPPKPPRPAATPAPSAEVVEVVEVVEQVERVVEPEVAVDGDGAGVPEGDGEAAPDVESAPPVVVGVADEHDVPSPDLEPVEDGPEALGAPEGVGEERDGGVPPESLELGSS